MAEIQFISGRDSRRPTALTVGSFDGLHLGHMAIIERLLQVSSGRDLSTTVLSFDPHPREVLGAGRKQLLTTLEERSELCLKKGVDAFAVLPFDGALAALSPREYVRDVLLEAFDLKVVVVGHDHRFGKGATGNAELLGELGAEYGFHVVDVDALTDGGAPISSSRIRAHIAAGQVQRAAELLGRPYQLAGTVEHGDGRGKTIGYPTANIRPHSDRKISPANGVYAVRARIDGEPATHGGMMNIGTRPTFNGTGRHFEVHLFDFDRDLYGRELRVEFGLWVREEQKFGSAEQLVAQLKADEVRCRAALDKLF